MPGAWAPRLLSAGWLRMFGRYSFCLYLIHLPVMWTVRYEIFDPNLADPVLGSALPAQALFWFASLAPAVGLAWLSWHAVESPILRLKRFFPY
jgi:peptidoglycan/LPS O-acetylase OafA/YrhL